MEIQEASGDVIELIQHMFHEQSQPSEIRLEDGFTTIADNFIFLCDLFLGGAKLYNNIPFTDTLPALSYLRPHTLEFLTERMQQCLHITPQLFPLPVRVPTEDAAKVKATHFTLIIDEKDLLQCTLNALDLNVQLKFQFFVK